EDREARPGHANPISLLNLHLGETQLFTLKWKLRLRDPWRISHCGEERNRTPEGRKRHCVMENPECQSGTCIFFKLPKLPRMQENGQFHRRFSGGGRNAPKVGRLLL